MDRELKRLRAHRYRAKLRADPVRWAKEQERERLRVRTRRNEKNAEYCSAYRARIHAAVNIEPIDREYVIARDMSVCHLCGKRVARHDIELDHLVPLSRGGDHTHANLAVAHRSCNRRRGAGYLDAQLRLVG